MTQARAHGERKVTLNVRLLTLKLRLLTHIMRFVDKC